MEKTLITFIPSFATFACGGSGDLAPRARKEEHNDKKLIVNFLHAQL
jgi:hypothetical protein